MNFGAKISADFEKSDVSVQVKTKLNNFLGTQNVLTRLCTITAFLSTPRQPLIIQCIALGC